MIFMKANSDSVAFSADATTGANASSIPIPGMLGTLGNAQNALNLHVFNNGPNSVLVKTGVKASGFTAAYPTTGPTVSQPGAIIPPGMWAPVERNKPEDDSVLFVCAAGGTATGTVTFANGA